MLLLFLLGISASCASQLPSASHWLLTVLPGFGWMLLFFFSPDLRKAMNSTCFELVVLSSSYINCFSTCFSTWTSISSIRQSYLARGRAACSTCSKLHNLQEGSYVKPHVQRFVGLESTSYTDLKTRCPSTCQMSFQVNLQLLAPSQCSQLHCFRMATDLICLPLSSCSHTSFFSLLQLLISIWILSHSLQYLW